MIHGQMQQQAQTAEIGSVVRKPVRARRINWVSEMASWAFVAPYLIAFVLFLGYPICFGFYISLHHWSSIVGDEGFAGIGQYAQLFNLGTLAAQDFWNGMKNTVIFVCISVPLLWAVPTVLAYLIYKAPFRSFFRPFYFFPTVLSSTAIASIWIFLLATQGGAINSTFHLHLPWLVEQPWAWISLDGATLWWTMGFNLVIMYAGITQLSSTVLEAAAVDGAGPVRTFFAIVLPQLRNVSLVVIVTSTIASFNLFAQPLLMTGGGPGNSTETVSMVIYNQGFNALHMGSASAMAYLMGILLAIVAFVQYRFGGER